MEKPTEVSRNYNKTDELMLEQAQTMRDNFVTDKAVFAAPFLMFADPFGANWQTAIDTADALPTEQAVLNEISLLTQTVEQMMVAGRNQYQAFLVYVQQVYPNDAGILKLMGNDSYATARKRQTGMMELLELAYAKANSAPYKAALLAKGFAAALLNTAYTNLHNANKAQELAIANQPFATQTRHKAMNVVWGQMVLINDAAQVVWKDDFAKLRQYLLYPEAPDGGGAVTYNYTLPIPPLPLVGEMVTGNINGRTAQVSAIDGTTITVINATGVFLAGEMLTGTAGGRVTVS